MRRAGRRLVERPPTITVCYPGSFNPPTVAHLAVAGAAVRRLGQVRVDLVLSRNTLGKPPVEVPTFEDRVEVLERVAASRPWLEVRVTELRLLADIAEGYDALVMGADKWAQVLDPSWYGSEAARDHALSRLPFVLVAPRAGHRPEGVEILDVEGVSDVSASAARAGAIEHMLP
ncbi:MAG TPA: hypothetical protein VGM93_14995, partial [Acidimicrobiales bacterium]